MTEVIQSGKLVSGSRRLIPLSSSDQWVIVKAIQTHMNMNSNTCCLRVPGWKHGSMITFQDQDPSSVVEIAQSLEGLCFAEISALQGLNGAGPMSHDMFNLVPVKQKGAFFLFCYNPPPSSKKKKKKGSDAENHNGWNRRLVTKLSEIPTNVPIRVFSRAG